MSELWRNRETTLSLAFAIVFAAMAGWVSLSSGSPDGFVPRQVGVFLETMIAVFWAFMAGRDSKA